jgi:hypothetical protein
MGHVAALELPSQKGRAPSVGHVAAPERLSQEGRAASREARGSTEAPLVKEAMSEIEEHVAALELTLARRRGPGPLDTG